MLLQGFLQQARQNGHEGQRNDNMGHDATPPGFAQPQRFSGRDSGANGRGRGRGRGRGSRPAQNGGMAYRDAEAIAGQMGALHLGGNGRAEGWPALPQSSSQPGDWLAAEGEASQQPQPGDGAFLIANPPGQSRGQVQVIFLPPPVHNAYTAGICNRTPRECSDIWPIHHMHA